MGRKLSRNFYRRPCKQVAEDLLGRTLVRIVEGQRVAGTIVETEAYLGIQDRAAHTYKGRRTPRVRSMWGDGGTLYVYFTYGMHHCANVVAGRAENPVAVLIRALAPQDGIEVMQRLRGKNVDLCTGPARLCQAMSIDRTLDGADLVTAPSVWVEQGASRGLPRRIVRTPRIGVNYAGTWARRHLRYCIADNPHVSRR